jgi:hypothetical protein
MLALAEGAEYNDHTAAPTTNSFLTIESQQNPSLRTGSIAFTSFSHSGPKVNAYLPIEAESAIFER